MDIYGEKEILEKEVAELKELVKLQDAKISAIAEIVSRAGAQIRALTGNHAEMNDSLPKGDVQEDPGEKLEAARARVNELTESLGAYQDRMKQVEKERDELQGECANLARENVRLKASLEEKEQANYRLDSSNRELEKRLEETGEALTQLQQAQLPDQLELAEVWKLVQNLPESEKAALDKYLTLSSCRAFLVGLGEFSIIEEFWEFCARQIRNGASPGQLAELLPVLVALFNLAHPNSEAALVLVTPGERYDFGKSDRVGANGSTVQAQLLPGLRKPNGEVGKKALVTLR